MKDELYVAFIDPQGLYTGWLRKSTWDERVKKGDLPATVFETVGFESSIIPALTAQAREAVAQRSPA
jgi:hypothetical protein